MPAGPGRLRTLIVSGIGCPGTFVRVYGSGYAGSIGNDFDFICSAVERIERIERIDGDALWDCLSFVVMLEGGVMLGVK